MAVEFDVFDQSSSQSKYQYYYKMIDLKCEQKFGMGSTYDYNKEIQTTLTESIPPWVKAKCAIKKIIRSICSLMKINPLQTALLSWLLMRSKYDIQKISIESRTNIVEEDFDHKVLIYILLNAYYVKSHVNQNISLEIQSDILNHVSNFRSLQAKFNPDKSLKTLSMSDVNKIFNDWTCRKKRKTKTDYNGLVDKILYLSKTYNVGGGDDFVKEKQKPVEEKMERAPRKKRKADSDRSEKVTITEKEKFSNKGNKFPNSQEINDFLNPSQDNRRQDIMEMNPLRRSTRNMFQSFNFNNDYFQSQDNLFGSQMSGLFNSNQNGQATRQNEQARLRLKQTSSYDRSLL